MIQLVIVIITIALTAALALASINYLPWWHRTANDAEQATRTSMAQLEQAYDTTVRTANGVAPAPTGDPDGGLMSQFGAALRFTPVAPPGYTWTYGHYSGSDSRYTNLDYFCLTPTNTGAGEGVYRGLERARTIYSRDQAILGAQCGDTVDMAQPTSYPAPVKLTMFVLYTPQVTQ